MRKAISNAAVKTPPCLTPAPGSFVSSAFIVPLGLCEWALPAFPHSVHSPAPGTKEVCLVAHHINYGVRSEALCLLPLNGHSCHHWAFFLSSLFKECRPAKGLMNIHGLISFSLPPLHSNGSDAFHAAYFLTVSARGGVIFWARPGSSSPAVAPGIWRDHGCAKTWSELTICLIKGLNNSPFKPEMDYTVNLAEGWWCLLRAVILWGLI